MRLEKRCRACLKEYDLIITLESQLRSASGVRGREKRAECFHALALAYRRLDACNCSKKLNPHQVAPQGHPGLF